ncbi:hypothetical protein [Thermaurantiacus sp.]
MAAQPGDVVTLPKQPAPCGYVRLNAIRKAVPGVTVRIDPDQKIGLHISSSEGLNFEGGWFVGGGRSPAHAGNAGAYVISSNRISFRNARFGNAAEGTLGGAVFARTNDWEVLNSRFSYRWDGLVISESQRWRAIGNFFPDDGIDGAICTFPDGTVDSSWKKGVKACTDAGGVYQNGPHADAIQIYRDVTDGLVEGNRAEGFQQGMSVMGPEGTVLGIRRLWLVNNVYRGDSPHAFRWIGDDMFARGNVVGWPEDRAGVFGWRTVLRLAPARGSVGCENVAIPPGGAFDPKGARWDQPCANVAIPPAPAEPEGLPELETRSAFPGWTISKASNPKSR